MTIETITIPQITETFVFRYRNNAEGRGEVLRHAGRMASDPASSFTWYDATVLSSEVEARRQVPTLRFQIPH